MIKTLKELRIKALQNPKNYGRGKYFDEKKNPVCPIAVEIIPDFYKRPKEFKNLDIVDYAAKKLNCTRQDVYVFTTWWDFVHFNCEFVGEESKS